MMNKNLLGQITKEHIYYDECGNCDKQTMGFYISLPEDIQKEFEKYLINQDGTVDDHKYIENVWCEYWIDEDKFHWSLHFDGDTVVVSEFFRSAYVENMIIDRYIKEYHMNNKEENTKLIEELQNKLYRQK